MFSWYWVFRIFSSFKHIFINFNMFPSLAPKLTFLNLFLITFQHKRFILTNLVSLSLKLAIYPPKYVYLIMPISYTISQSLKDLPVAFMKYPWQPGPVISPETTGFPDWLLYWIVYEFSNSSQTPFTWICHESAPGQTAYIIYRLYYHPTRIVVPQQMR